MRKKPKHVSRLKRDFVSTNRLTYRRKYAVIRAGIEKLGYRFFRDYAASRLHLSYHEMAAEIGVGMGEIREVCFSLLLHDIKIEGKRYEFANVPSGKRTKIRAEQPE